MKQKRPPYAALRHRDFRLLAGATLISLVGTQMQNVAVEWHIYLLTHSALALGATGLVRVVPIIAFSLFGGVLADRLNRRTMMFLSESLMGVAALALAVLTWSGRINLGELYALTAVGSAASAFDNPARQALIPRLVPDADLPGALSLNLTIFHIALIFGPAFTGLMIAGSARHFGSAAHGLGLIYLLNAISFLVVLAAIVLMRTSGKIGTKEEERESPVESLLSGLKFVFSTPILVATIFIDFFATFFAGAMTLLPIFADKILHVGAEGYGWLRAAPAVGALLGSVYTSVRPLPKRQGRVFLWAILAYGVATVVFGFSRGFWLTMAALALTGASDVISTVIRQTIRQLITPDQMRGRMTSVAMIFFMGGPQLGEMEAGGLASFFAPLAAGAVISVVSGGIATIVMAGVVAAAMPMVRRFDWGE